MTEFRVVDLLDGEITKEILVEAVSPEAAAKKALGVDLVRSARKSLVRAKVYFCHPGTTPSMVRLYVRAEDRDRLNAKASGHVEAQAEPGL
jgi:hypothetical protein